MSLNRYKKNSQIAMLEFLRVAFMAYKLWLTFARLKLVLMNMKTVQNMFSCTFPIAESISKLWILPQDKDLQNIKNVLLQHFSSSGSNQYDNE